MMELSIDTASELASVALSRDGGLVADIAWSCQRNHTVELLPVVEKLLANAGVEKRELSAVFACTGPGMYTGLRVAISVAQGLARALGLPALGVGRLELDAYPHAGFDGPIMAVHRAGRGDLAWASYQGNPWRELTPPKLSRPEEVAQAMEEGSLIVGEVEDAFAKMVEGRAIMGKVAEVGRARALAELGFARLQAGEEAEPALLRPVYLRPPAIGPQERASR